MADTSQSHISSVIAEYTPRATSYEASNHGWHAELADDFVTWMRPSPGDAVLDLACGTGLVAFRMADAVGAHGIVVGVDVTRAMLDVARAKVESDGGSVAKITSFVEADVADPAIKENVKEIKDVLAQRGGFDVISCCSAVILFKDPAAAIKLWASMLKPGGKMIFDVVSEKFTIQYVAAELIAHDVLVDFPFSRSWVKGPQSIEKLITDAGMEVETCFLSRSYLPETVYDISQREEVFDDVVLGKYGRAYVEKGVVEEARRSWNKWWERIMEEGHGKFRDGHQLYIGVGRKM